MSGRGGRGTTPFERMLKQQCQKRKQGLVSASNSAGVVGRFGSASFTSLRGGSGPNGPNGPTAASKPKKFFKSRTAVAETTPADQKVPAPSYTDSAVTPLHPKKKAAAAAARQQRSVAAAPVAAAAAPPPPKAKNKFFTSKAKAPPPAAVQEATPEPASKVPPLKLRIKTAQITPPPPPVVVPDDLPAFRHTVPSADNSSSTGNSCASEEEDSEPERVPSPEPIPSPPAPRARATYTRKTRKRNQNGDTVSSNSSAEEEAAVAAPVVAPTPVQPATTSTRATRIRNREAVVAASSASSAEEEDNAVPVPKAKPAPTPVPVAAPAPVTYSRSLRTRSKEAVETEVVKMEIKAESPVPSPSPPPPARESTPPLPPPPQREVKVEKKEEEAPAVKRSKKMADDWGDDESSDDAEISFKDDSLVISPKNKVAPAPVATLTKAATLASSSSVQKELFGVLKEEEKTSGADSQPLDAAAGPSSSQPPKKKFFTKSRSIFKSKASEKSSAAPGDKKYKSLYKHNWNNKEEDKDEDEFKREVLTRAVFGSTSSAGPAPSSSTAFDDAFDDGPSPVADASSRLVKVKSTMDDFGEDSTVTSVKCHKAQKGYFTVIKNVKAAHQIQDSGEFQEFNDDVEYILGGLGAKNSLSTRCLSTVTLASKCMEPGFRMHLRAHGTVTQFFKELRDAPANSSLALCASTVLFVLSQDRLNMDLDRDSLELMLNLLDTDSRIKDALESSGMNRRELEKNKQKVLDLVSAMKSKGHAINLSLEHITADHLSMETLLSLTSKRAGEWFKEELRDLGGLDHLVRTLSECVNYLTADDITMWTDQLQTKLKKADRVLKVLENVTHENEENCSYLLKFENGRFLGLVHTLYKLCNEEVALHPDPEGLEDKDSVQAVLREALFDGMRVYINLVHDYHDTPMGSAMAGSKPHLFDLVLHCLFLVPGHVPVEKRFDTHVLSLTMIINLVENCKENRTHLMNAHVPSPADAFLLRSAEKTSAAEGLIKMFLQMEENARMEESKTDNILDGKKEDKDEKEEEEKKSQEERIDETVAKLLHKAGRHMEDTLIASYITLIIGYLIMGDKEREATVRTFLPDKKFTLMLAVIKKFFNFMNLTASATITSSRGLRETERIINYLSQIDKSPEDLAKEAAALRAKTEESFEDVSLFDVSKEETTFMEDMEAEEEEEAKPSTSAAKSYSRVDFGSSFGEFGKL